jgi:hypothetical protein
VGASQADGSTGEDSVAFPDIRGPRRLGAAIVVLGLATTSHASAYAVRQTASGIPVRWPSDDVSVEVDPSLVAAVPDAAEAAGIAASAWTAAGVGPKVRVTLASSASAPAVDGRNVIYYIPGYPPAGKALAITLVSYDDVTGAIVDTDIVINGAFQFGVLPSTARASATATPIANEPPAEPAVAWLGIGAPGSTPGATTADAGPVGTFDLLHVLVHETGHVLGLRDTTEPSDVMYLSSSPGDASRRAPTADDLAGVTFLYTGSGATSGCDLAAPRRRPPFAVALFSLLLAYLGACRRRGQQTRKPGPPTPRLQ